MMARIYKPARTAMQQGRAKTQEWVLEFEPAKARAHDPLMGWTSSADTRQQVVLTFDTKEAAIAYANKHGIAYLLKEPPAHQIRPKSYAENFRWNRVR
jgi:hypothetical protein